MQIKRVFLFVAVISAISLLPTWATAGEPRPPGVSRFIAFSVEPVYPKSFDITAAAQHSIWGHFKIEELKNAWHKKAMQVANGRKFKITKLVVHDNEDDLAAGWPIKFRNVSGTITLAD